MAEIITTSIGRTADHYKVRQPSPDRKPELERPPDEDVPDFDEDVPGDARWSDERRRQERGNRGPREQPGFGQGA